MKLHNANNEASCNAVHGQQLSLSDFQIQIVEERLVPPAAAKEPSTIPFGAMSYGPLFQRQQGVRMVTKERRQRDRAAMSASTDHPKSIYEEVRKRKLTASKKPSNVNFWMKHTTQV